MKENATSAAVNGTPSEKTTPGCNLSVTCRRSSETVQLSASEGSTTCVALLIRTSFPCVRMETSSAPASRWTYRLNDPGSVRMEATSDPPRCGLTLFVAEVDEDSDDLP